MTRTERPPCDHEVRERVTRDLTTTFLLEASAGTGKTKVLVDRYVACVLDADRGTQDVRRVAAITFTEKAAGELRHRVRERFEQLAEAAPQGAAEAPIIAAALDALDDAPISTIHSFAGRLLREFPVEAGIDPAFEQLDQLGSEIERARLWEEWLTELAAGGPGHERSRGWLKRLLWAGIRLDVVRELAMGAKGLFGERYDLDPAPEPPPAPDLSGGLLQLLGPLDRLREHCVNACTDRSDNGFKAAMDLVTALDQCATLAGEETCDLDQLATALLEMVKDQGDPPNLDRAMHALAERIARPGQGSVTIQGKSSRSLTQRLTHTVQLLNQLHYRARWEAWRGANPGSWGLA